MRDSIRINRNFESLSLRFVSRCLRTATAFLIRCQRSSGMEGARPKYHAFYQNCDYHEFAADVLFDLRIRRILLPVTKRTWGIPYESRSATPIWDGVRPLRASLMMCSTTSSGVVFNQDGGVRRYGRAEDANECTSSEEILSQF